MIIEMSIRVKLTFSGAEGTASGFSRRSRGEKRTISFKIRVMLKGVNGPVGYYECSRGGVMKISVEVTGIEEQQLSEAARRLNVPEEELALAAVRDLLAQREADFDRAATHVLAKNRELYRRLA